MVEPQAPNQTGIRTWGRSLRYVVYILGVILLAQTVADVATTRFPVGDVLFMRTGGGEAGARFVLPSPNQPMLFLHEESERTPPPKPPTGSSGNSPQPATPSPEPQGGTPAPEGGAQNTETDRVFIYRGQAQGPMPFTLPLPPPGASIDCEETVSPAPDSSTANPQTGATPPPQATQPDSKPPANDGKTVTRDCLRWRTADGNVGFAAVPFPPPGPGTFEIALPETRPLPISPAVAQNGLIAASLIQLLVGVAALVALYQLCRHYEHGQIFSADNARLYRRLGLWLIAFSAIAIIVPIVRWLSVYAGAPIPPPFDWRFLAIDLWLSPYLIFAVVGIFVLLLGRVMAESASLAEDAKLTI